MTSSSTIDVPVMAAIRTGVLMPSGLRKMPSDAHTKTAQ